MDLDEQIPMFLAVTGTEDAAVARQFLTLTNNDLEYAVTLYMEQHPPQSLAPSSSGAPSIEPRNTGSDEDFARRLQEEAYAGSDSVREADASVHRHETLVEDYGWGGGFQGGPGTGFGGMGSAADRPQDIFGRGRVGVFNQRFDNDETDFYEARTHNHYDDDEYDDEDEDEDDNEYEYGDHNDDEDEDGVIVVDSDGDEDIRSINMATSGPPRSRRRQARENRMSELTSTQRRLADLFRPPFDLMQKVNLDTAKKEGREQQKWILVNIQDFSEFACQVMNRDFWSNSQVKRCVKDNFVFVQYQHDSPNGVNYVNFYHPEAYPHLAILDPLTGERVKKWPEGKVPDPTTWVEEVIDFLGEFSLQPDSKNPMVNHEVRFDPDKLTEEQQIEYAMKQLIMDSKGKSKEDAIDVDVDENENEDEDENSDSFGIEDEAEKTIDPWDKIEAQDHIEPSSGTTTRIQFRFPNGKRVIHKFSLEDEISVIISWLKYVVTADGADYGISGKFAVSNASNREFKLLDNLDMSISDANLKNSSILIEQE